MPRGKKADRFQSSSGGSGVSPGPDREPDRPRRSRGLPGQSPSPISEYGSDAASTYGHNGGQGFAGAMGFDTASTQYGQISGGDISNAPTNYGSAGGRPQRSAPSEAGSAITLPQGTLGSRRMASITSDRLPSIASEPEDVIMDTARTAQTVQPVQGYGYRPPGSVQTLPPGPAEHTSLGHSSHGVGGFGDLSQTVPPGWNPALGGQLGQGPGGFSASRSVSGSDSQSVALGAMPGSIPGSHSTSSIVAIRINAATNLKNADTGLFGDVSDPYVIAKIGNEEQRTLTIQDDLNPIWRDHNLFTLQVMTADTQISLRVMNENRVFHDDCIGETEVDIASLPIEAWCQFREKLRNGGEGELEFDVYFKPNVILRRMLESVTILYLRINGAINLKNTDTGLFGDVSDPYVLARVGKTEHRTPTIDDDLNPIWKDHNEFCFRVEELDTQGYLELEVFNENSKMRKDDSLGKFEVKLEELKVDKWLRRREKLQAGAGAELEFDIFLKPSEAFRIQTELAEAKARLLQASQDQKRLAQEVEQAERAAEWLEDIEGNTKMPKSLEERDWEEAAGGRNLVIPAWIIPGTSLDQRRRIQSQRQPLAVALFPTQGGFGSKAPQQLKVRLLGAFGLQSVMTGCAPNAYCICEIPGKASSTIVTPAVVGNSDPDWEFSRAIESYTPGDSLFFRVFSADPEGADENGPRRGHIHNRRPSVGHADELLGEAGLQGGQFYPNGFDGPLDLVLASRNTAGRLHVMVIPTDAG